MKIRVRSLVLLAVACVGGGLLMHVSQEVQESQDALAQLRERMDSEREAIILLQAEWEALNAPTRLEVLARKYLPLRPPETHALHADLPQRPPASLTLPGDTLEMQPVALGAHKQAVQP